MSGTLANTVQRSTAGSSSSPDDYYQTVAINALLSILRDQSLSSQHHKVIEAIMLIFKTQGLKCVSFLPQVRVLMVRLEQRNDEVDHLVLHFYRLFLPS